MYQIAVFRSGWTKFNKYAIDIRASMQSSIFGIKPIRFTMKSIVFSTKAQAKSIFT